MQKILVFLWAICSTIVLRAQITPNAPQKVGVQTRLASETLDVNGTVKVRELPFMKRGGGSNEKIYNGETTKNTIFQATHGLYVNENGVVGRGELPQDWFILPHIRLPLSPSDITTKISTFVSYNSSTKTFTVRLGHWAKHQLAYAPIPESIYTNAITPVKSPSASKDLSFYNIRTNDAFTSLDYSYMAVSYYDANVYESVALDSYNQLTYKIKENAVITSKTYMNILVQNYRLWQ